MMSKLFPFLLIYGGMLLMTSCPTNQTDQTLVLMTYNIYHGENPYQKGTSNAREIAKLIRELKPDLIALQEVDSMTLRTAVIYGGEKTDLVKEWANMTGMQGYFAKAIDYSDGGYGEGLLSSLPAKMSSLTLPSPKGGEGRSMAIAVVTLKNGQQIGFGATHLCHESEANRTAQVAAILNYIKGTDLPFVLAGDFNFETDEPGYRMMEAYFTDGAKSYGDPKPTYPADDPKIRIDYIWLSKAHNWEIKSAKVFPVDYSDHRPLLLEVTLD